jgi:hypothetical protein
VDLSGELVQDEGLLDEGPAAHGRDARGLAVPYLRLRINEFLSNYR